MYPQIRTLGCQIVVDHCPVALFIVSMSVSVLKLAPEMGAHTLELSCLVNRGVRLTPFRSSANTADSVVECLSLRMAILINGHRPLWTLRRNHIANSPRAWTSPNQLYARSTWQCVVFTLVSVSWPA